MSETNPLLPQRSPADPTASPPSTSTSSRLRASFNLPLRRTSRTSNLSSAEVHPDPDRNEPLLPASAPHPDQQTRLHRPQWWTKHYGRSAEPNAWAKFRYLWREEFAEFWGTFTILLFGTGVECQVNLHYVDPVRSSAAYGSYLQGRLAWAAGVALSSWIAGGISGGHCNPSVTLALALFRRFPARKIPTFLLAQLAGATLASLLIYANYYHSITRFERGPARTVTGPHATAPLFFTFPQPFLPWRAAFFSEFLASAALLLAILALSDKANLAPPRGTQPFAMFLVLLAIGAALGVDTGYAINGARDTGPRIALYLVGYGSEVFTHDAAYFLWAPWGAGVTGAVVGSAVYDLFLYTGRDSPVNRPKVVAGWAGAERARDVFEGDDDEGDDAQEHAYQRQGHRVGNGEA